MTCAGSPRSSACRVRVAHVEGDDLVGRADELGFGRPLTANAYLGGWGIAACLDAGADIVVTGRVTDASLVVGPAASHFGWSATTGTASPAPWSPATSSSAARRRPVATSRSSASCDVAPARLPARGDLRRRLEHHHEAPGHRRRRHRRHREGPARLRDRRPPLCRPRRHRALRHHRGRGRGPDRVRVAACAANRRRRT